jgi:hypothetical protein
VQLFVGGFEGAVPVPGIPDDKINLNRTIHHTRQQAGDGTRQAAMQPITGIGIRNPDNEVSILVRKVFSAAHPGVECRFWHIRLELPEGGLPCLLRFHFSILLDPRPCQQATGTETLLAMQQREKMWNL